jgi:putative oxidoreductase
MLKEILNTDYNKVLANLWLLILRLSAGGFMLTHGYPKLTRLFDGGEIKFGDPIGIGPAASLVLAVFAEFLCAILVGLGLFTRLSSIPLIITMLVAAFHRSW